ncbi:hypothetical protein D3C76_888950 [compost metagenome]
MGLHRVIHRRLNRRHGRQVRHGATPGHRTGDQGGIGNVADNQLDLGIVQRQVAAFTGGQIVENPYRITLGEQGIGEMGADETGAPGNQNGAISHDDRTCPEGSEGPHARRVA